MSLSGRYTNTYTCRIAHVDVFAPLVLVTITTTTTTAAATTTTTATVAGAGAGAVAGGADTVS